MIVQQRDGDSELAREWEAMFEREGYLSETLVKVRKTIDREEILERGKGEMWE